MTVYDQLMADLRVALRDQDEPRKQTIRMALAALKNARVAKNADLTEEEMFDVLNKEVKQRRDAIVEYEKGNRQDLADEEQASIEILIPYLPERLDRDTIVQMAQAAIVEAGASNPREMGQVMRILMPQVKGRADGRLVNEIVKELLSQQAG
jgi:uncharacterized protein YqeY